MIDMPSRVADVESFWSDPPPKLSARCLAWVARIHAGWRPNKRVRRLDYHSSAEFFGVYIWEYSNVLRQALALARHGRWEEGLRAYDSVDQMIDLGLLTVNDDLP